MIFLTALIYVYNAYKNLSIERQNLLENLKEIEKQRDDLQKETDQLREIISEQSRAINGLLTHKKLIKDRQLSLS